MSLFQRAVLSSLRKSTLKHLLAIRFQHALSGEAQQGLWIPVDFHFGVYLNYRRALEMPLVIGHRLGERHLAVEMSATMLLHFCIILDFRKVQLNGGKHRVLP